jgi:hypothetical protein
MKTVMVEIFPVLQEQVWQASGVAEDLSDAAAI